MSNMPMSIMYANLRYRLRRRIVVQLCTQLVALNSE